MLNTSGVTITTHGATIANYDFWLDAVGTVRNVLLRFGQGQRTVQCP